MPGRSLLFRRQRRATDVGDRHVIGRPDSELLSTMPPWAGRWPCRGHASRHFRCIVIEASRLARRLGDAAHLPPARRQPASLAALHDISICLLTLTGRIITSKVSHVWRGAEYKKHLRRLAHFSKHLLSFSRHAQRPSLGAPSISPLEVK